MNGIFLMEDPVFHKISALNFISCDESVIMIKNSIIQSISIAYGNHIYKRKHNC